MPAQRHTTTVRYFVEFRVPRRGWQEAGSTFHTAADARSAIPMYRERFELPKAPARIVTMTHETTTTTTHEPVTE